MACGEIEQLRAEIAALRKALEWFFAPTDYKSVHAEINKISKMKDGDKMQKAVEKLLSVISPIDRIRRELALLTYCLSLNYIQCSALKAALLKNKVVTRKDLDEAEIKGVQGLYDDADGLLNLL